MKLGMASLAALIVGVTALPALADRTDVLYSYKSWKVEGITFDDGTYACLAEVSDPGESFSIWISQDQTIQLEFYSQDWDFGDSGSADLEVEIDRRGAWTVPGATLKKSSVFYDLTGDKEAVNLVLEVAKGNTLHLRSADGTPV